MTLATRCCTLAPAADIYRHLPPAPGLQQTSFTSLLLSTDGTDFTDRRSPDRYVASIMNEQCCTTDKYLDVG